MFLFSIFQFLALCTLQSRSPYIPKHQQQRQDESKREREREQTTKEKKQRERQRDCWDWTQKQTSRPDRHHSSERCSFTNPRGELFEATSPPEETGERTQQQYIRINKNTRTTTTFFRLIFTSVAAAASACYLQGFRRKETPQRPLQPGSLCRGGGFWRRRCLPTRINNHVVFSGSLKLGRNIGGGQDLKLLAPYLSYYIHCLVIIITFSSAREGITVRAGKEKGDDSPPPQEQQCRIVVVHSLSWRVGRRSVLSDCEIGGYRCSSLRGGGAGGPTKTAGRGWQAINRQGERERGLETEKVYSVPFFSVCDFQNIGVF